MMGLVREGSQSQVGSDQWPQKQGSTNAHSPCPTLGPVSDGRDQP